MLATAAPPTSKGKNHTGDELRLEFQDHDDSAVILLHGRFARPLSQADRERVFQLAQDKREITIDFSGMTGFSGMGLRRLLLELRQRQMKNPLTILFLSQGVPMILMGDEIGRSQQGNNNAYCQDGPLSWMDWSQVQTNSELLRYCKNLIAFRHEYRVLRRRTHAGDTSNAQSAFEVSWHGTQVGRPDWAGFSRTLAMLLKTTDGGEPDVIYAAFNLYWEPLEFELPPRPPDTAGISSSIREWPRRPTFVPGARNRPLSPNRN